MRRRIWLRWGRNSVRRPGNGSRLRTVRVIVRAPPPRISRLTILVGSCWLLLLGLLRWIVIRWQLLWGPIRGRGLRVAARHLWLLRWLLVVRVIRCTCQVRLRWLGSCSLRLAHCRVVTVIACVLVAILKTETSYLSLYIIDHFSALYVSGHNIITALLLYICDCILLNKASQCDNICLDGCIDIAIFMDTSRIFTPTYSNFGLNLLRL